MIKSLGIFFASVLFTLQALPTMAAIDERAHGEIIVLCEQLLADYAVYRDHLNAEQFANTFSEGGVLILGSGPYNGRDEIHDYIGSIGLPAKAHMFMFTTHQIEIESAIRATGISYALVLGGDRPVTAGEKPIQVKGIRAVNEYHTEFELTDDGWKISKLSFQGKFSGPR